MTSLSHILARRIGNPGSCDLIPPRQKIVVRMKGGLGNQLFIYAFARGLQLRTQVKLEFDLHSGFVRDSYKQRFWLKPFRGEVAVGGAWDSYRHPLGELRRKVVKQMNERLPLQLRRYVLDPEKDYRPEIANIIPDGLVYFDGYWESHRYFEDCEPLLRQELDMEAPAEPYNLHLAEFISGCEAIAVHARRLKSVPNSPGAKPNELHPQLTLDYYHQAVARIAGTCRNPRVFCFSDYPDWFQQHFKLGLPTTYIRYNHAGGDSASWKDLWLMRQCQHFVVANSSFSWWGAWLANRSGKKVIYPQPTSWNWVRNADMMPVSWEGRPA